MFFGFLVFLEVFGDFWKFLEVFGVFGGFWGCYMFLVVFGVFEDSGTSVVAGWLGWLVGLPIKGFFIRNPI